jgi:hypothetical protein
MTVLDTINRVFREFKRYTGDGLAGEPTGAALPIGDPQSGPYSPKKSELRAAFIEILGAGEAAADDLLSRYLGAYVDDAAASAAAAALEAGAEVTGQMYFNTTDGKFRVWNGDAWQDQSVALNDGEVTESKIAASLSLASVRVVPSRASLKALSIARYSTAYLSEPYREGVFEWKTGNYSAQVTADPYEGLYVKADAVAATAGAWVRKVDNGVHQIDWWGARGAADILPIWESVKALVAGATLMFGAAIYTTSATLAYEGASNKPITIRGVSETETIVRKSSATTPVWRYFGVTGGGNEVRGGGISHMKLEKTGGGICSGIEVANVYRADFHHINADACGNVAFRITSRGAGDTDATAGCRFYQLRARNQVIAFQIRGDTSGAVPAAYVDITDSNFDGALNCGLWVAGVDQLRVRNNTFTNCGNTGGGAYGSRGGIYLENFGITNRNVIVEQNEFGNGFGGYGYDVMMDGLVGGLFARNRHLRNAGEVATGGFLLGFVATSGVFRNVVFDGEQFAVASTAPYVAFSAGGAGTVYIGNVARNIDFLLWNIGSNTAYDTASAIATRVNAEPSSPQASNRYASDVAKVVNRINSDGGVYSFERNGTQVGAISVTSTATSYSTSSDELLKTNVPVSAEEAREILRLIRPRTFVFNHDADKTVAWGFFAQELYELYPQAVIRGSSPELFGTPEYKQWQVDLSQITPILAWGWNDLDRRLANIESRIE